MSDLESQLQEFLTQDEIGVWKPTATASSPMHYPEDGNMNCFALEDGSFWFRARNAIILDAVKQFHTSGEIWDVGGGNGAVSKNLTENGFPCVLLEPGESGALNGKRHRNIPVVICASTSEIHELDGQVPAIGLFDVLEHIEQESMFLEELWQLLKPGGHLFVTVPAHSWLWSQSDIQAEHFRRYSRSSLLRCLKENRFTVKYCSAFFRPLVLPLFALRSLPFRMGLSRAEGNSLETEKKQHAVEGGLAVSMLNKMLHNERMKLAAGRTRGCGTSILCVAQKRPYLKLTINAHPGMASLAQGSMRIQ